MEKKILTDYYIKQGYDNKEVEIAISAVENLEKQLDKLGKTLENVSLNDIKKYVKDLIDKGENKEEILLALARYFYLKDDKDIYIYFTSIFGSKGVIENIKLRTIKYAGEEVTDKIFENLQIPPLGTSNKDLFNYTKKLMHQMEDNLAPNTYRKILAGNNHNIPEKSISVEKEFYKKAKNIDEYLKDRHLRKVEELQQYCDQDQIWFEQKITQDVVDYVKSNQEILSGVRKEEKIYITKIPYDIINFLKTDDQKMKKYYACHCPFVRESLLLEEKINADWCYCSAGFAKFPFEVIFDTELDVELIESPLKGDNFCRFAVHLPEKIYKIKL